MDTKALIFARCVLDLMKGITQMEESGKSGDQMINDLVLPRLNQCKDELKKANGK